MQHDPLRSAYREAARLYLWASDMPPDIRACFVDRACAGNELVHASVRALIVAGDGLAPRHHATSANALVVANRLHRFLAATSAGSQSEVTAFVPSPDEPDRHRALVELIKLDQKARWSAGEMKALEAYLHEWPELRTSASLMAELLHNECLVRAVFASPATDTELPLRFPALAASIDLDDVGRRAELISRGLAVGPDESTALPPRFSLVRKVGQGGMGVVYEAMDRQRGTVVAVKTVPRMEPVALVRFKREFRSLTGLSHRNLVSLYELVSDGSQWLFTMELVSGTPFVAYVQRHGPTTTGGVVRAALQQLTEGVIALHAADILHCDLKPSNVLVQDDGRVVILDFGVVREISAVRTRAELTRPRVMPVVPAHVAAGMTWTEDDYVLGSLAYMSPEQVAGDALTEASDWYSVGVMLYESITGRIPFAGDPDILTAKQSTDPVRPSRIVRGLADDLDDLCMALLGRDPAARPRGDAILDRLGISRAEPQRRVAPHRALPFVGRSVELRTLEAAYGGLHEHGGAITVHISGRSGSGKTTLVRQFLRGLPPEALVLLGRCYEQESVPYKALDSVVDRLCRHLVHLPPRDVEPLLSPDVPALARIFPALERVSAVRAARSVWQEIPDARDFRRRAFAALGDILRRLGRQTPLVLFIDDLQWGDVDSAALLISLLDAPQPPPLLFIAGYRTEHVETNPCLVALAAARRRETAFDIDLQPLPYADSLQLASRLLQETDEPSAAAAQVARESRGNPYFVYELVRQVERVRTSPVAGADEGMVLDLDQALRRRVLSLGAPAQQLLEVLAIAGKPLRLRSIADAAGLGAELPSALGELRAERLVRSTGPGLDHEVETYHDRIRESVRHHLSAAARAEHHRRLAFALEATGHTEFEETASHFLQANLLDRAARHYARAADKAAVALAFDRAAVLYGLAIELHDDSPADIRVHRRKRADALANAGRGHEAAAEYQRAAHGAGTKDIIELQRNAGYQYCVSGHIDHGREAFAIVLAHFGTRLPRTRRRAVLSLLWRQLHLRVRGFAFDERSEAEVPREVLDRVDVFWSVAAGMSIADLIRGADFQTLDLILALRAGEPYRITRALGWQAAHLAMLGVRVKTRVDAQLALADEIAQRIHRPHASGMILLSRAVAAYFHGQWSQCQQFADAAARIFRERCTGVAWEMDTCNAFAFWPLCFMGEYGELTHRFERSIAEVRDRGSRLAEADLTTFGGPFVWLAADNADGAEQALHAATNEGPQQDFHMQQFTRLTAAAQIALYRGDGSAALRCVLDGWPALRDSMLLRIELVRVYMQHLRARCALAASASGGASADLLRAAGDDARRLERERPPYARALALTIRAGVRAQQRNRAAAAPLLLAAADELTALGWGGFGTAARRQYGIVIGGDAGAQIVLKADQALIAQQVKRPDRLCAVLVPGCDVPGVA